MADTSATICSSLRTPAQRVRHRLERCPRWEWNHCPPSVECANGTFNVAEPTWANACVGENGNPQIIDYAEGFASAAKTLLNAVIAEEGLRLTVDTLIYPICFNMRHAVELFLKSTAQRLKQLGTIQDREVKELDLVTTHDLSRIWMHVKETSSALDTRYDSLLAALGKV